jgi:hypothetical protein
MTKKKADSNQVNQLIDASSLKSEEDILSAYFAACRQSYLHCPNNLQEKTYLENNKELFRISSYFDIPRDPVAILANWGLPENLRGFIHLDERRREAIEYVLGTSSERNIAIIGDPGVGKTTVLFALFEEMMKIGPTGILTTVGLSEYHRKNGIRLFYDDLPENAELANAIEKSSATGIIVTAREQDFKCRLSQTQQAIFEKVYVRDFSKEDILTVAKKLLDMQGIAADTDALQLLADYAQGSPIYVWSVVRDLANRGERRLNPEYLRENASKGMVSYVSRVMQRLLKDGEKFKPGGLHTLTMLVFMATQMRDKRCHSLYFRKVSDMLDDQTAVVFQGPEGAYNVSLQSFTLEYLSGKGNVYRFPHDCWADILTGAVASPFSARVDLIQQEFEITGIFESVKTRALTAGWTDIKGMFQKRPDRFRESLLEYAHMALRNFEPGQMERAGIPMAQLRIMLAREQGHPLADLSLSMLDRAQPVAAASIINIQDSVIMKSQIGAKGEGLGAGETGASEISVKDSVVQGTAIGARGVCPACDNLITGENKLLRCKGCGEKLCTTCEGWIEKKQEHEGRKFTVRYPLCEKCHSAEVASKVAEIEAQIEKKRKVEEKKQEAKRVKTEQLVAEASRKAEEERKKEREAVEQLETHLTQLLNKTAPDYNETTIVSVEERLATMEPLIAHLKIQGVDVFNAERYLHRAKEAFLVGELASAHLYLDKSLNMANESKDIWIQEIKNDITRIESILHQVSELGADISVAEKHLSQAKTAFENHDYSLCFELKKQAERKAMESQHSQIQKAAKLEREKLGNAQNILDSAIVPMIREAEVYGINIVEISSSMQAARNAIMNNDYVNALTYARDAESRSKSIWIQVKAHRESILSSRELLQQCQTCNAMAVKVFPPAKAVCANCGMVYDIQMPRPETKKGWFKK